MFAGIYYGAMYGGSTTSILLNTPGESATVVTALEGHQMAERGRGGAALSTAAIGSFVAGTLATLGLSLAAPALVRLALRLRTRGVLRADGARLRADLPQRRPVPRSAASLSLFIGLALGLVGIDALSGQARLTFGIPYLLDGIDVVIVAVGLFAVGEALTGLAQGDVNSDVLPVGSRVSMTRDDWSRSWKPWLRGTAIGFPLGALPAGGAELPTLLSYAIEKRLARGPEEFGHGAIEGVAGPEAANNAAAAGTLVPLLTLGCRRRRPRPCCSRRSSSSACSPDRCSSSASRRSSGASSRASTSAT